MTSIRRHGRRSGRYVLDEDLLHESVRIAREQMASEAVHSSADLEKKQRDKYSLDDLARMRKAMRRNPKYAMYAYHRAFDGNVSRRDDTSRYFMIEDMLRTFILNGTTPQELEAAADEFWEQKRQKDEAIAAVRSNTFYSGPPNAERTNETAHNTAVDLTMNLPLDLPTRIKLRTRIEIAILRIIERLTK